MLSLLLSAIFISYVVNFTTLHNKNVNIIVQLVCYSVSAIIISYAIQARDFVGDTINYENTYFNICNTGFEYPSIGFHSLNLLLCNVDFKFLLFIVPIIGYFSYLFLIRKNHSHLLPLYFLLITMNISFLQLNSSGIKQGISISFMIISLAFLSKGGLFKAIFFGVISTTFHWATTPFLMLIFITTLIQNKLSIRYLVAILFLVSLGSFWGVFDVFSSYANLFMSNEDKVNAYIGSATDSNYRTGFRLDFFLYSIIPLLIIRFTVWKSFTDNTYLKTILSCYIILNSAATFLNFIPFSDRMYAYSWSIIPILLIYTINEWLKEYEKKALFFAIISLVVLLFFLFSMNYNFRFLMSDILWA